MMELSCEDEMSKNYAFPGRSQYDEEKGMSLRDWFAGQALSGLLASNQLNSVEELSYLMADAMLKERDK